MNYEAVFRLVVPEAVLGLAACALFVGGTFRANRHLWAGVALSALIIAGWALCFTASPGEADDAAAAAVSPLLLDRLALLIKGIALVSGVVLVLLSWNEVPDGQAADYHACLLLTVAGLCLTGAANELVTLFLALELIGIPTYVLLYLPRADRAAQEAAVKYFLLSIFSSALLLFGFSYLYGLGGMTNLSALMALLTRAGSVGLLGIALVALVMVVAGLSFKIAAVPFHFYAPDVYQGAPTATVALLAFIPKAAGFTALMRGLGFVGAGDGLQGFALGAQVPGLFWILAALTMSVGNILALLQDNLKRLLAYSSVAHAGYMLIGLAVAPHLGGRRLTDAVSISGGVDAVLFYLAAYGAMTVGAFAVVVYLSTPQRPVATVDDLAGLSRSHPGVALFMLVFLFSLIGIPLTAGFAGKLALFFGALAAPPPLEHPWLFRGLAVIGGINTAVAAWYYLRIVAAMYFRSPIKPLEPARAWPGLAALWICAAVTLGLGVYPWPLFREARAAVALVDRPVVQTER